MAENDEPDLPADGHVSFDANFVRTDSVTANDRPDSIGPYRLLDLIGEGGMGRVYRAEQRVPVRRIVAIKLIKLGMDTREVIARFESERQALAMMDHPNIARILDAGASENGRPYFVMEFVPGEPITDYCDRHQLTTRHRLELFATVCEAVQHAHMKGVIHRDIKPSNILISVQDSKPAAKVIDFGVAKATSQRLTERTLFTETGQLIGTPEYMSPEQAEMSSLDVDTRSDIYSLGVVLYELLSGALPFDPKTLRRGGYHEIQRMIRDVEPPKPSTKLSSLDAKDAAAIAGRRQQAVGSLRTELKRELEWIPLKAIRKDRTHRYKSASDFADDIANYLAHRPLIAGPESTAYRVRSYVRRNRVGLAVVTLLLLLLSVGLVGALYELSRAKKQAEHDRQVGAFLSDLLVAVEPGERSEQVPVTDVLSHAKSLFGENHPVVPRLLAAWAETFAAKNQFDAYDGAVREAIAEYRKRGGDGDERALRLAMRWSILTRSHGDIPKADRIVNDAVDEIRSHSDLKSLAFAKTCDELLYSYAVYRNDALNEDEKQLNVRLIADRDNAYRTACGEHDLRTLKARVRSALRLNQIDPSTAHTEASIATIVQLNQAAPRDDVESFWAIQAAMAAIELKTSIAQSSSGTDSSRYGEQLAEMDDRAGTIFGVGSDEQIAAQLRHASWLRRSGDERSIEKLLVPALAIADSSNRASLRVREALMWELACCEDALSQWDASIAMFHRLQVSLEDPSNHRILTPDSSFIVRYPELQFVSNRNALSSELQQMGGAFLEARTRLNPLVLGDIRYQIVSRADSDYLAWLLSDAHPDAAKVNVVWQRIIHTIYLDEQTAIRSPEMAQLLLWREANEPAAAVEPAIHERLDRLRKSAPASIDLAAAMASEAQVLMKAERFEEAKKAATECLNLRRQLLPADHWQVANAKGLVGEALANLNDLAAAEPLLLESYRPLMNDPNVPQERSRDAIARLVLLYQRKGDLAKVREWQARMPTTLPVPTDPTSPPASAPATAPTN